MVNKQKKHSSESSVLNLATHILVGKGALKANVFKLASKYRLSSNFYFKSGYPSLLNI
jgi:hypothetical protein